MYIYIYIYIYMNTERPREREREKRVVKMVMSILVRFLYTPPPGVLMTAMSVLSGVSLANGGLMEMRGKHMQYSKFLNLRSSQTSLPSRSGMLIAYTPAFLVSLASFSLFPPQDFRLVLLTSALCIHFIKRIFEVLFIHKYSGGMVLDAAIPISLSYFLSTASMIYTQCLSKGFPEPPVDLKYAGIVIFLVGISGNFYHHCLLSKLRETGDREYKVPKGGLFSLVICPHYLFEIIGFIGVCCISQTIYAFSFTLGTVFFLIGRSYATRKWYLSKYENFPKDVKSLIPCVF